MEKKVTTLGESRVRTDFNAQDNGAVSRIKTNSAELIDIINRMGAPEGLDTPEENEFFRLKSLAMTAIEEGAMWAVKAATIK